jgi:hypothetical protein
VKYRRAATVLRGKNCPTGHLYQARVGRELKGGWVVKRKLQRLDQQAETGFAAARVGAILESKLAAMSFRNLPA